MSHSTETQVVRLKKGKATFELLCHAGAPLKYRQGLVQISDVLFSDDIWKSVSKGDKHSPAELESAFGTANEDEIKRTILEKGDIQFTAAERREFVEQKRREIINYIHSYYINPQTKTPHPVTRIENALDQLRIVIDADAPVDRQVKEIVKRLPEILPIRKQGEIEGILTVPNDHIGTAAGPIKRWCTVKNEKYTNEGCTMEVSIISGDFDSFIAEMAKATKGDFNFNVQGTPVGTATMEEDVQPTKGKAKGAKAKAK